MLRVFCSGTILGFILFLGRIFVIIQFFRSVIFVIKFSFFKKILIMVFVKDEVLFIVLVFVLVSEYITVYTHRHEAHVCPVGSYVGAVDATACSSVYRTALIHWKMTSDN